MAKKSKTTGPYAYISNSASSSITVIDTSTRQVVGSPIRVGGNPGGLSLTPKEEFLYVANGNPASHSVSVIDTSVNKVVARIDVGLCPSTVAASADGNTIYAGLLDPNPYDKTLRMRDAVCAISTRTNKMIAMIDMSFGGMPVGNSDWPEPEGGCGGVGTLAMRPNRPHLYVPISNANKIAVIDTISNCVIKTFQAGSGPGLAFAPNALHFYEVCTYNLGLTVFDASDDSMVPNVSQDLGCQTPEVVAVTPDSGRLYVLCVDSHSISVRDATKPGFPVIGGGVQLPFQPSALAFTPDCAYAYVLGGGDDAKVIVIETLHNTVFDTIKLPDGGPDGIVIGKKTY